MTSYRKFSRRDTVATVATVATFSESAEPDTVATVATVATLRPAGKSEPLATVATVATKPESVASVATVATLPEVAAGQSVATVASVATVPDLAGEPHDLADPGEREAMLIADGGIPECYAAAFAALQQRVPAGVDRRRWELFLNDAGLFLDAWGREADECGWTPADLFGLHPTAPLARYDEMGALWLLKGNHVEALTAEWLRLSKGLKFFKAARPGKEIDRE